MNELMFYDAERQKLNGSITSKARKFNKLKCIKDVGIFPEQIYDVLPIQGYNSTAYKVDWHGKKCTCQASVREEKTCSHILAVSLFRKNHEMSL